MNNRKFRQYKAKCKAARVQAGGVDRTTLSRAVQLNAIERKRTRKLLRQRKGDECRKQWSVARDLPAQGKGAVVRADRKRG